MAKPEKIEVSPEEAKAEEEGMKEAKEDEIRDKIVDELDLNEEDDASMIDKLVAKEVDNRTRLSQAIGQKIKHRERANELTPDPEPEPQGTPEEKPDPSEEGNTPKVPSQEDIGKTVNEALDQRDLNSKGYPEELQEQIKRTAQISNISVQEALKDPYVASLIEAHDKEQKTEDASNSRTNQQSGDTKFDVNAPPKGLDMNTEEGRKAHDAWMKKAIKATS
jgi:hypothetical protein|tara:strand:- start:23743 stop:24405 length:663 start_codon:yes stop_codon:yes gene_type:complete